MRHIFIFTIITSLLFLNVCKTENTKGRILTLTVELKDKGVSFHDIFKKIELIPLELNDSSYIKQIDKIHLTDGELYILDRDLKSVNIFDSNSGSHIHTISKAGQGPDEYTHINDLTINSINKDIKLMSPFNFINTYDISGNFIKRDNLPFPDNSACAHFYDFDDANYIFWVHSQQDSGLGKIVLLSKETNQIINSFWRGKGLEDSFIVSPFWKYNGEIYFSSGVTNNVYKISPEGYELTYKWDFGKYDIDKFRKKEITTPIDPRKSSERTLELINQMINSNKLYRFNSKLENNNYYYAQIVFNNNKNKSPHIFYNKKTNETFYFFETTEGISFITHYMTDKYILGEILLEQMELLLSNNTLDEEQREKLMAKKFDDNPILVKLYFK